MSETCTPGTWHFKRHPINHTCELHDEHGCFGTVHREHAELIIKAVNEHAALIAIADFVALKLSRNGEASQWVELNRLCSNLAEVRKG